ncbi:MAG: LytTR family transcriptional regulator DNA-binding domain-containing protein [Crocinitomicaceae bacterium]|nr:LytTR family transcriptional regulator DNA-binding domain-containing protein [Crocinitomicaceae bacterium]
MYKKRLAIFLLITFTFFLRAESLNHNELNYIHIDSPKTTYKITQGHNGFVYIGSNSGLLIFNGFSLNPVETEGNEESPVLHLYEDHNNILWILDFSGGVRLMQNQKFLKERYNTPIDQLSTDLFFRFVYQEKKDGDYYLGTETEGYIHLRRNGELIRYKNPFLNGFNKVMGAYVSGGNIYLVTALGVVKSDEFLNVRTPISKNEILLFDNFQKELVFVNDKEIIFQASDGKTQQLEHNLAKGILNHVNFLDKKTVGLSTKKGYYIYQLNDGVWKYSGSYHHDKSITNLYLTYTGVLFIGTHQHGLFIECPSYFQNISLIKRNENKLSFEDFIVLNNRVILGSNNLSSAIYEQLANNNLTGEIHFIRQHPNGWFFGKLIDERAFTFRNEKLQIHDISIRDFVFSHANENELYAVGYNGLVRFFLNQDNIFERELLLAQTSPPLYLISEYKDTIYVSDAKSLFAIIDEKPKKIKENNSLIKFFKGVPEFGLVFKSKNSFSIFQSSSSIKNIPLAPGSESFIDFIVYQNNAYLLTEDKLYRYIPDTEEFQHLIEVGKYQTHLHKDSLILFYHLEELRQLNLQQLEMYFQKPTVIANFHWKGKNLINTNTVLTKDTLRVELNFLTLSYTSPPKLRLKHRESNNNQLIKSGNTFINIPINGLPNGRNHWEVQYSFDENHWLTIEEFSFVIKSSENYFWFWVIGFSVLVSLLAWFFYKRKANKNKKLTASTNANHVSESEPLQPILKDSYILVKSGYDLVKIYKSDIIYIKSAREYVEIYLSDKPKVLTLLSMNNFLNLVNEPNVFVRIHRSFSVNLKKVSAIEGNSGVRMDNGEYIPIGKTYQKRLAEQIKNT